MWPRWYRPGATKTGRDVIAAVAKFYGVTIDELTGPRRTAKLVDARWVAAKALQNRGKLSYPAIGRMMNRDHTSIMHACQSFNDRAARNPDMIHCLLSVA